MNQKATHNIQKEPYKMKYLIGLLIGLLLVGCGQPTQHQYINGTAESTITKIGKDRNGNSVFVREIIITRGDRLDMSHNKIFVSCDEAGVIIPSIISNNYKSGKAPVDNTTIIGDCK